MRLMLAKTGANTSGEKRFEPDGVKPVLRPEHPEKI